VKAPRIVLARISFDVCSADGSMQKDERPGETAMIGKILSYGHFLAAGNEKAAAPRASSSDMVSAENVRALATGAALAVALDASPAVLVSIYDYAHRFRQHQPRRIVC
jgi:hypothetical protein